MKTNNIYTISQLAERLQISERSLLDSIRAGNLKAYKKFRRWFVFASDLEAFIKTGNESTSSKK